MIIPTINVNGSSADTLLDNVRYAIQHLSVAKVALESCYPDKVDYPNGCFKGATDQYLVMLDSLWSVINTLEEVGSGISKQR